MLNMFKAFKAKNLDETKAFLAAIYRMMMADDMTKKEESDSFWAMCKDKGLNQKEIHDVISQCSRLSMNVPTDKAKQKEFFNELIAMMKVDGVVHPSEMALLRQYAEMIGYHNTGDLPPEEWS